MRITPPKDSPVKLPPSSVGRKAGELTSALMAMPPQTTITLDFDQATPSSRVYPAVSRFARKIKGKFVCRRLSSRSFAIFRIS